MFVWVLDLVGGAGVCAVYLSVALVGVLSLFVSCGLVLVCCSCA